MAARAGAARIAQERGVDVASANGVLLLLTSGLETGFSLLARGSILSTEEGEDSSHSRLFFFLDFLPPVS